MPFRIKFSITRIWKLTYLKIILPSLIAQQIKNPPALQETPVRFLEKGRPAREWINYPFQYSWASTVSQMVKICLQSRRPRFDPWVGKICWRRKWPPTPVFWPGEFHGERSLAGYSPWGRKEQDTAEQISLNFQKEQELGCDFAKVPCAHAQAFSHIQQFVILWTVAYQAPLPMLFTRNKFWSGLLFSSPGNLLPQRIKPTFLTSTAFAGRFFTTRPTWEVQA